MQKLAWLAKLIKENHKVVIQTYTEFYETQIREGSYIHLEINQLCTFKFNSVYPTSVFLITRDSDLYNILRRERAKFFYRTDLLSIIYKQRKDKKTTMEVRTDMDIIYNSLGERIKKEGADNANQKSKLKIFNKGEKE